jgi:PAS domain S-box-containing protein
VAEHGIGDAAVQAIDIGLIGLDTAGKVTLWNDWTSGASGIAPADAAGRALDELFPGKVTARLRNAISEALSDGASSVLSHTLHPMLLPLRTRAGRDLIHNVAIRPMGEAPHTGCLIQITDVTLATERERVLRDRQSARYDAVVRSAVDPILTIDTEGLIQFANQAATHDLGYDPAAFIGRPFASLLEAPEAWEGAWRSVLCGEPVHWPIELIALRRDGSRSYVGVSAAKWSSGGSAFVTAILRDVNERRAAEANLRRLNDTLEDRVRERTAELERAHEQLRQSQKVEAIGQLTGGIAHDFNNLLTPILGGLDVLSRRGIGDPRGQRLIDGALQSAERARGLVQRLLAFARRQPLQPCPVDLGEIVRNMSELVGSTLGPRIRIVIDIADDLPPAKADPNQLEMALLNLAVNARDAMPDGGVLTISARIGEVEPGARLSPGRYLRLAVSDTGIGMDSETLNRAVEPFFSTKGIGKGTGLGLSMIHGLAAQLGGWLDLSSTPNVGTTVEMWLPTADAAPGQADRADKRVGDSHAAGLVLLVDDEELIRATTSQMLSDLGFTVIEASSGREGLKHLSSRLALVVSDHLMPGMTGTEFAREVQAVRPDLPILIISGFAELDDVAPDLPRLMKPFRETELAAAVAGLKH